MFVYLFSEGDGLLSIFHIKRNVPPWPGGLATRSVAGFAGAKVQHFSEITVILYVFYFLPATSSLHVSMTVRPTRMVVCTKRSVSINDVRVYWRTSRRFSPVSFHTARFALY